MVGNSTRLIRLLIMILVEEKYTVLSQKHYHGCDDYRYVTMCETFKTCDSKFISTQWLQRASQKHKIFCHGPGMLGSNPGQVELTYIHVSPSVYVGLNQICISSLGCSTLQKLFVVQ